MLKCFTLSCHSSILLLFLNFIHLLNNFNYSFVIHNICKDQNNVFSVFIIDYQLSLIRYNCNVYSLFLLLNYICSISNCGVQ